MNSIMTDSGIRISNGTIVMLARYPGIKWTVRNGWYTYQGQQYTGWYFCSIGSETIIPMLDEDLALITVLSGGMGCDCNPISPVPCPPPAPYPPVPPAPPTPPCPPPDPGTHAKFDDHDQYQIDRAFISVNTLDERNQLSLRHLIPDGKMVRVNQAKEGEPGYYAYCAETQSWRPVHLEQDETRLSSIEERLTLIEEGLNWLNINKEVIE